MFNLEGNVKMKATWNKLCSSYDFDHVVLRTIDPTKLGNDAAPRILR
jgi:hypothetical protein